MTSVRENRFFATVTVALVGVLILGLVGIGGFYGLKWWRGGHTAPSPTKVPTQVAISTPTPTKTPTPQATATLLVASTSTPTVGSATPTATPSLGGLPASGWGGLDPLLLGMGLVGVMVVARLLRKRT